MKRAEDDSAELGHNDRRSFLAACGKYSLLVPPAMTMLLSTSLTSTAIAKSGGGGGGGGGGGSTGGGSGSGGSTGDGGTSTGDGGGSHSGPKDGGGTVSGPKDTGTSGGDGHAGVVSAEASLPKSGGTVPRGREGAGKALGRN
jgi:hypothetical protein